MSTRIRWVYTAFACRYVGFGTNSLPTNIVARPTLATPAPYCEHFFWQAAKYFVDIDVPKGEPLFTSIFFSYFFLPGRCEFYI